MRLFPVALLFSLIAAPAWAGLIQPPPPVAGADCASGASLTGYPYPGAPLGPGGHCGTPVASGTINLSTVGQPGVYTGTGTITGFTPGGDVSFASPNYTVTGWGGVALGAVTATGGNIMIASGSQWVSHAISGDLGLSASGLATIQAGAVTASKMGVGAAATNVGTLGGALGGTLPNPNVAGGAISAAKLAAGAAASNIGSLGADLTGTLPNPTIASGAVSSSKMASGAAAANVGTLGGDLSGTLPSPTVTQLQGRPLVSTAPSSGQLVGWNGATWGPVNAPVSGINALTQDVTASGTGSQAATVVGLQGRAMLATAPSANQLIGWNGSAWGPVAPPTSGINQLTGDATAGPGTGSQAIALATTGVTPGNYQLGPYCQTIDSKGRVTSMVLATCGGVSLVLRNGGGHVARNGGGSVERNGS